HLSGSFVASVRVRYDVWTRTYRIEGVGLKARAVTTLDSVRLALSSPFELPLAPIDHLSDGRYYVVGSATLKPLSVEGGGGGGRASSCRSRTSRRGKVGCPARSKRSDAADSAC